MSKMRAVQVPRPNGPFELVEREIPEPRAGAVRIRVQACGICHSDSFTKEGHWPGIQYPRVPGHEIAGIIDEVGSDVVQWKKGQRVGIGWHGGHCGVCDSCRRGSFVTCRVAPQVPGISYDGGYADYMVAPAGAVALIPAELAAAEAAPLMCAGVTTFNALRKSGARAGETVAVLGLGGHGHLGIQFAAKMGFRAIAIARGRSKERSARTLGAQHYIDSQEQDPATELTILGGAKVILATTTDSKAISASLGGLDVGGKLILVGAGSEPLEVPPTLVVAGRRSIEGYFSGTSIECQDALSFSALTGVRSVNELFPLERATEAYELMMSGKARFRAVLTTGTF